MKPILKFVSGLLVGSILVGVIANMLSLSVPITAIAGGLWGMMWYLTRNAKDGI